MKFFSLLFLFLIFVSLFLFQSKREWLKRRQIGIKIRGFHLLFILFYKFLFNFVVVAVLLVLFVIEELFCCWFCYSRSFSPSLSCFFALFIFHIYIWIEWSPNFRIVYNAFYIAIEMLSCATTTNRFVFVSIIVRNTSYV